jgi:hypothetical protein
MWITYFIAGFLALALLSLAVVLLYKARELFLDLSKSGEVRPNRKLSPEELAARGESLDGKYLLAMEFIDGETRLIGNKPMSREAAARLATYMNEFREQIGFVQKVVLIPTVEEARVLPLHEVVQGVFDKKSGRPS